MAAARTKKLKSSLKAVVPIIPFANKIPWLMSQADLVRYVVKNCRNRSSVDEIDRKVIYPVLKRFESICPEQSGLKNLASILALIFAEYQAGISCGHNKRLLSQLGGFPSGQLCFEAWIFASKCLCYRGFFLAAKICREKGMQDFPKIPVSDGALHKLSAIQFEKQIIAACVSEPFSDEKRGLGGRSKDPAGFVNKVRARVAIDSDALFRSYVSSHEAIAVVGPSAIASSGEQIEAHDCVVRLNAKKSGCLDPVYFGSKTDISYFNGEHGRNLKARQQVMPDIKWACFKVKSHHEWHKKKPGVVNGRQFTQFDDLFFTGSLNLGPAVLLDLLGYRENPLNIFNFDLMLTVERSKNYHPRSYTNVNDVEDHMRASFATHDPCLNFFVMKYLWLCGYVKVDRRLEDILSSTIERYLMDLERVFK